MSLLDKLKTTALQAKDKAVEAVDDHAPQIKDGIGKAGDYVDKKTKGKYTDKVSKGTQQAHAVVDKIHKPVPDTPPPSVAPDTPSSAGPDTPA